MLPLPPRVRRVLTNTVWAQHVTTVTDEILGSGTGNANQTFGTAQTPVQPGHQLLACQRERPPADEERVLLAEEGDDAVVVTTDASGLPDRGDDRRRPCGSRAASNATPVGVPDPSTRTRAASSVATAASST